MNSKIGSLGKQITTAIDHAAVTVDRYGHRVPLVGSPFLSGVGVVAKGIHALGKKLFPAFFTGSSAYMTRVNKIHKKEYAHPFSGPKIAAEEIHVHRTINRLNARLKKKMKEFDKQFKPINKEVKPNPYELAQTMVDLIPFMNWISSNKVRTKTKLEAEEFKTWAEKETKELKEKNKEFYEYVFKFYLDNFHRNFDSLENQQKKNFLDHYSSLLTKKIHSILNENETNLNEIKSMKTLTLSNEIKSMLKLNLELLRLKILIRELIKKLSLKTGNSTEITDKQLEEMTPLTLLGILNSTIDEYKNVNE